MPTDADAGGVSGGPTPPSPPTPSSSNLKPRLTAFQAFEGLAKWLDVVRKIAVSLVVIVAVAIATVLLVRETRKQALAIDPVIVELLDLKEAMTPELAAQTLAKHLDAIQHSGAAEWSKLYVDHSSSPIDLQIPGVPFTMRAGMREVASLFGRSRTTIQASIVSRRASPALAASVYVVGDPAGRASCESYADASGMDRLLECVALEVMTFVDPKVAASYAFNIEKAQCKDIDAERRADEDDTTRELRRLKKRRSACGFERTRSLIAKALERGRPDDRPWVSYVYGRVHLARAIALTGIDREDQLSELDQAIGRFMGARSELNNAPSAVATLFEAYVMKGTLIHEATTTMPWQGDAGSPMQYQLYLAEATFEEAEKNLKAISSNRTPELNALVKGFEGQLYYRLWMIKAHQRTKKGIVTVADRRDAGEMSLLERSNASYAIAAQYEPTAALLTHWGNTLRALHRFEDAASRYLQAADLAPDWYAPRINVAIAYLDRVEHAEAQPPLVHVLYALGSSSDYLGWVSGGDPLDGFLSRIDRALARTGVPEEQKIYQACRPATPRGDYDKMVYVTNAKQCLDKVTIAVNLRAASKPRAALKGG
ncbi:MAG: hypothetical protein EPO41_06975 [Reyranella sp.]|uniref:hypothetical protein n=1 Tax=Reyranella sp. TaxID=1929291 RepID=UPI0011FED2EC|nr:hypothetical protein [Reyranella sp.]TAJ96458.1 MAG: hypothetical protein EPO41_06975 [Reyranella sp.]